MKYTLIDTSTLATNEPSYKMFKGIPWSIVIQEKDGYWYSKWQVSCHYPSPTGDSSDWCSFDIGCLNKEQALHVAAHYQKSFGIPNDRVMVQTPDGGYAPLEGEYSGPLFS